MYKLDTVLLKQNKLPLLDIMRFFSPIRAEVKAFTWVLIRKNKPVISITGHLFYFNSIVSYTKRQQQ